MEAVAALILGGIAGSIGLGMNLLGRTCGLIDHPQANGGTETKAGSLPVELALFEQLQDLAPERYRVGQLAIGQDHGKLIAAEA